MTAPSFTNSERSISLDALRTLAAFAVVWLHAASRVVASSPDISSANWWVGNFSDAASRWCVPVFVMISGALLLSRESTIVEFYRKRVLKLAPILIFWTLFYGGVTALRNREFDAFQFLNSVVLGVPHYHLWFLYMIVGLYAVTPFIRKFLAASDVATVTLFVVFCFFLSSAESLWGGLHGPTFLSSFIPFIGYYVAGFLLTKIAIEISIRSVFWLWFMLSATIGLLVGLLFPLVGEKAWGVMYSYHNPLVIVMSLAVYTALLNLKINNKMAVSVISKLAPLTLGVYVIHPIWLSLLSSVVALPYVGILASSIAVFILSLISAFFLTRIPLLRRTI